MERGFRELRRHLGSTVRRQIPGDGYSHVAFLRTPDSATGCIHGQRLHLVRVHAAELDLPRRCGEEQPLVRKTPTGRS